jgi:hypothetical protein
MIKNRYSYLVYIKRVSATHYINIKTLAQNASFSGKDYIIYKLLQDQI